MCFNVSPRTEGPLVATEDIVCYKIVIRRGKAAQAIIYSEFVYELNQVTVVEEIKYHPDNRDGYGTIANGYHSFHKWYQAAATYAGDLAEFIIPIGALYYKNGSQYVSNQIKMVGFI
jgi:hypothetical protein